MKRNIYSGRKEEYQEHLKKNLALRVNTGLIIARSARGQVDSQDTTSPALAVGYFSIANALIRI